MHALLDFAGVAAAHTVADVTAAIITLAVCLRGYRKLAKQDVENTEVIHS